MLATFYDLGQKLTGIVNFCWCQKSILGVDGGKFKYFWGTSISLHAILIAL